MQKKGDYDRLLSSSVAETETKIEFIQDELDCFCFQVRVAIARQLRAYSTSLRDGIGNVPSADRSPQSKNR